MSVEGQIIHASMHAKVFLDLACKWASEWWMNKLMNEMTLAYSEQTWFVLWHPGTEGTCKVLA